MADTTANRAETPRRRAHLGARWRLTLWFTGLFVVIGAVLLGLNYYLVQRSYHANPDEVRVAVADELGVRPGDVHSGEEGGKDDDRDLYRKVQAQLATDHLDELLSESALALVVMAAASFGVSWVLAGRVLRPVHTMTTTARQLSESNLHERIALEGPDDELKELADTFDAMLARLEAAFAAQRRFVADASHELRTPLAIIRAEIDVTLADPDASRAELRAMAETVRDATERSEHLIDSLLVLARSDAAALASERCDLAAVARLAADTAATEVRVHHLDLDLSLQPRRPDRRPIPVGAGGREPGAERGAPQRGGRVGQRRDAHRRAAPCRSASRTQAPGSTSRRRRAVRALPPYRRSPGA